MIDYPSGRYDSPCTLLLGGFDGLHTGHETLVKESRRFGLPVGIMMLLGKSRETLFTEEERFAIYTRAGVDFCYRVPFTEEVKNTSPEAFLRNVCSSLRIQRCICGSDFRFGAGAKGTPELISRFVPLEVCPLLTVENAKISSTLVKEYLKEGKVAAANALLCGAFFVTGRVEHGRSVGHTIGFPTANIDYPAGKVKLKYGVYAVSAEFEGKRFRGIANYGAKPTFGVETPTLEVYFDGYDGDLYGRTITLFFDGYLRDIRTFANAEELKNQLRQDVEKIR